MKRILTIVLAAVAFFAAENTADAQLLKNIATQVVEKSVESNSTSASQAMTTGTASGKALKELYVQYKKDGKIDISNLKNLSNLTILAGGIEELKQQSSKSAFYKDFAKGLVGGSNNLVNDSNSSKVMNLLMNSATGNSKSEKAVKTAETVVGVLKLFKDKE